MASFQLLTGTFSLIFLIIVLSILAVSLTSVLHLVKSHDFAHGNCSERCNCASSSVPLIENYLLKAKSSSFRPHHKRTVPFAIHTTHIPNLHKVA